MTKPEISATLEDGQTIDKLFGAHKDQIVELEFRHRGEHIVVRPKEGLVVWNGEYHQHDRAELVYFRRVTISRDQEGRVYHHAEYHVGVPDLIVVVQE